jgi:predicted RNA-binding Zn ribbon-like protein
MPAWLTFFISPIISAGVAFSILYINYVRDKRKGSEGDEKTWRQARLEAEKALGERITAEERARIKWELENAGDLAHIVEILKEVGEIQRLLASTAATSQHHTSDIASLNSRLNELQAHVNQFVLRHVKPA